MIIIISSPSGGGKTTIAKGLLAIFPNFKLCRSYTTRTQKEGLGEEKYIFVSKEDFEEIISKGEFIEWAEVFGDYYGTPNSEFSSLLDRGSDILLDIDVDGAEKIKALYPEAVLIFLLSPSILELKRRLIKRKRESEEELIERLKRAEMEIKRSENYDYRVVNEEIEKTIFLIKEIIIKERRKKDVV
ncbi:guanylate kinase [bacterium]|nr:guanylate kinase [bacterium]MBU1599670.1 guanylate kinase [bacterium]MBU2461640.1 guanylate kinase [bacterium]